MTSTVAARDRSRYPWFLVGVGWLIYGLGISPAYYSWGFFAPEIIGDLELDRTQTGFVFTVFAFLYSAISPFVGMSIDRFGLRWTVTLGALVSATGFFVLSGAESLLACVVGYGILGGVGVGASTILPAQTLAARWFVRNRARALAILMTAGGIVGLAVPLVNERVLEVATWREGWQLIGLVAVFVAVLAAIFLRDTPESVGLLPDGDRPGAPETSGQGDATSTSGPALGRVAKRIEEADWDPLPAMRTWQFALLCLAGIAFSGPWNVVISHGRLHFEDLGLETSVVAVVFSTMILLTTVGRLAGAFGDWLAPQRVLALSLVLEGSGVLLFLIADDRLMAHVATIMVAIGFGGAYVSIAVTFAAFFGRRAFALTAGTRQMIQAFVAPLLPTIAGSIADATGTYDPMWIGMGVTTALVGVVVLAARPPARREPRP